MRISDWSSDVCSSVLAHLGTPVAASGAETLDDLARDFDIGRVGRAAPKFDPAELERLNARALHALPFAEVAPRPRAMEIGRTSCRERGGHSWQSTVGGGP